MDSQGLLVLLAFLIGSNFCSADIAIQTEFDSLEIGPGSLATKPDRLVLTCVTKSADAVRAEWYRKETSAGTWTLLNEKYWKFEEGNSTYTAPHKPTPMNDLGIYNCTYFNANDKMLGSNTMNITSAPMPSKRNYEKLASSNVTNHQKMRNSYVAETDSTLHMICEATGFPSATFQWHKIEATEETDELVAEFEKKQLSRKSNFSDDRFRIQGPNFTITAVSMDDRGIYVCSVNNSLSPMLHLYYHLRVRSKLAPLYPLLGLLLEAAILGLILVVHEYLKKKREAEGDDDDVPACAPRASPNAGNSNVRQRTSKGKK